MTSDVSNDKSTVLTREQRRAVRGFGLAVSVNCLAYQVFFGNFLSLFVNQIGFSSLLIGMLFLVIQIPAVSQIWVARYADRHGCKRLLVNFFGWGSLTLVPLVLAPQIAQWFGRGPLVVGMFLSLTAFALCSAAAMAAWMPLLRQNLPSGRRAQLVGRINQTGMALALAATLGYSLFLGKQPNLWQFQVVFIVTALLAASRAAVFRRFRDVEGAPDQVPNPLWHDLGELWANLPFRRLIIFQSIIFVSAGIAIPFRPLYVTGLGFSTRFAAFVTSSLILAAYALVAQAWGFLADRYGSRGVFAIAGSGVILGYLVLALPRGHSGLDAAIITVGFTTITLAWAGLDAGTIHRLFSLVPRRNQSLYMVFYPLSATLSMALGSGIGGLLIQSVRALLPQEAGAAGFALALEYRILFGVVAMLTAAGTLYSRRMRDMKEISTKALLLDLHLRTQRWFMNGRASGPLRIVGKSPDTDDR